MSEVLVWGGGIGFCYEKFLVKVRFGDFGNFPIIFGNHYSNSILMLRRSILHK